LGEKKEGKILSTADREETANQFVERRGIRKENRGTQVNLSLPEGENDDTFVAEKKKLIGGRGGKAFLGFGVRQNLGTEVDYLHKRENSFHSGKGGREASSSINGEQES